MLGGCLRKGRGSDGDVIDRRENLQIGCVSLLDPLLQETGGTFL